jgi:hypothetical protein
VNGMEKQILEQLRGIRKELQNARTIPSVPIELRRRSVDQAVDHILGDRRFDGMQSANSKLEALQAALQATTVEGQVAEFGVYKGDTLTRIATYFGDQTVHGFDSFIGLPESWSGTSKGAGAFGIGGVPPELPVTNVEFHVGFFDTTVAPFEAKYDGPFAFCHMDADLYSSTKTVFDTLFDWFVPGTVILFDEYFGYYGWQHHEHKAFMEFLAKSGLSFEGVSLGHMNLAVRLIEA